MIVDKKSKKLVSDNAPSTSAPVVEKDPDGTVVQYQQMPTTGIINVFEAIKEILSQVRWEYGNPKSPLIFNTVQLDSGQFDRIVRKTGNLENGIAFPAVFIHFINIHWLKPSSRVREGRAELRVRFIMNRLNVHDSNETEEEGFRVAERIKQDFEEKGPTYECLKERLSLDYFDQVQSFDDSLQPWWMSWDVWFKETSVWASRKRTRRFIVFPPFVNHADQPNPPLEGMNPDGHNNLDHPITYDEATTFTQGPLASEEEESSGT